jgi:hypothetical protein
VPELSVNGNFPPLADLVVQVLRKRTTPEFTVMDHYAAFDIGCLLITVPFGWPRCAGYGNLRRLGEIQRRV